MEKINLKGGIHVVRKKNLYQLCQTERDFRGFIYASECVYNGRLYGDQLFNGDIFVEEQSMGRKKRSFGDY